MIITITDITVPGGCGHLLVTLRIDGVSFSHIYHRGEVWESPRDILSGCPDKWDVLLLFLRSHVKKYLENNPGATLAQIRADVLANFRVVL
jgi:hypothetical protein